MFPMTFVLRDRFSLRRAGLTSSKLMLTIGPARPAITGEFQGLVVIRSQTPQLEQLTMQLILSSQGCEWGVSTINSAGGLKKVSRSCRDADQETGPRTTVERMHWLLQRIRCAHVSRSSRS